MKNAFLNAYQWLTGCTMKEANKAFSQVTKPYILSVIQLYRDNARTCFYED